MRSKKCLVVLLAIAMVFVFASCQQEVDSGIAEVSFASGNNAGSKAVTTGDGERIAFEGLNHQIKFISNSGTGYCDLAGAKGDFVAWPTSSVKLGYGNWTVCAQSVNSAGEVVYKNDGVAFTVGNSGLYVDGVKSSNVVITESYCYSAKAKIAVSENLKVLTEDGTDIKSLDAGSPYRTDYTVKWFTSNLTDLSSLSEVDYVDNLTGFTYWENPTVAREADGLTYALGVIADNTTGFIQGLEIVMLEDLSNGRSYTIGLKSSEYLQFGVRAIEFLSEESKEFVWEVDGRMFYTLQNAIDYVKSTSGKTNNQPYYILLLRDVPEEFEGDAIIDFEEEVIIDFAEHAFLIPDFTISAGEVTLTNGSQGQMLQLSILENGRVIIDFYPNSTYVDLEENNPVVVDYGEPTVTVTVIEHEPIIIPQP